jgi:hypothetical protein
MVRRIFTLFAFVMLIAVPSASAQQPGDRVTFAVPEEVTLPSGDDPGDKVLFVGGPTETTSGGTCAAGTFGVQNVVLVDPRSQRAPLRVEAVVLSPQSVAPGTRLTNLTSAGPNCVIGTITYARYTGTVD